MAKINENYNKLAAGYLFPEISRRVKLYADSHPGVEIFRLGIGDTTEPLTPTVIEYLHAGVDRLGTLKEYSKEEIESSEMKKVLHEAKLDKYNGYGDEQGNKILREAISRDYKQKGADVDVSEVFVSDGAKPDSANIQSIFGLENIVAVQDPAYPVYVDTNVIAGRTGNFDNQRSQYSGIVYMPCNEGNGFFPEVPKQKVDLIYLCSPNNPTGTVASKQQLKTFVDYAKENKAVIIFDAAYCAFIRDNSPKTIYQVEGAKDCAIELNSFSKDNGFTGVRLGWTVVPKALKAENAEPGKINSMWNRRQCTFFNGASNVVQEGGLAALTLDGRRESMHMVDYYLNHSNMIANGLRKKGIKCFGGVPYVFAKNPNFMKSWDFFDKLLNECHVVSTPGAGFGPSGEGYTRFSPFNHTENVVKALESIQKNLIL